MWVHLYVYSTCPSRIINGLQSAHMAAFVLYRYINYQELSGVERGVIDGISYS